MDGVGETMERLDSVTGVVVFGCLCTITACVLTCIRGHVLHWCERIRCLMLHGGNVQPVEYVERVLPSMGHGTTETVTGVPVVMEFVVPMQALGDNAAHGLMLDDGGGVETITALGLMLDDEDGVETIRTQALGNPAARGPMLDDGMARVWLGIAGAAEFLPNTNTLE